MISLDISAAPSSLTAQERQLARFVTDYFAALQAQFRWEDGVLIVSLDEEQATALNGVLSKPQILQLAFQPEDVRDQDTELICLGSFRLEQILESTAKRGQITHQFGYTDDDHDAREPIAFIPFLFVVMQLSCIGPTQQMENCIEVGCNLVTGEITPNPYQRLVSLYRCDVPPFPAVRYKRRVSFLRAYRDLIGAYITEALAQTDHQWAQAASAQLVSEAEEVNRYFATISPAEADESEDNEATSRERELRLKEALRRNSAEVQVRPLTAAIIYLSESACLH